MARDFRANNIRISKIIGSGSAGAGKPTLLIYSSSSPGVNTTGGYTDATLLSGVDGNTWLFISGSKASGDTPEVAEVLFGGNINVAGDITTSGSITAATLSAPADNSLLLKSDVDMIFRIDSDGDGTESFQFKDGANSTIAELNEAGTLQLDGDLTVSGGDIVVGTDADGTDRTIVFGHTTLKSIIGIDDDQDVFAINTDATFEAANDFEIDASGNVAIKGDLKVVGGDIQDGGGHARISFPDTGALEIKDIDGTTVITTHVSDLSTTLAGTLQVDGNSIKDSGGDERFSFANAGTTIIKDASGDAVITAGASDLSTTLAGDLTVTGGDVVVGSDADGADRTIVFGHSTLKSIIGVDDDQDVFAINTDATFESGNDLEIDASGNVTLGSGTLQIGGNVIKASDGGSTITMDTSDNVTIGNDLTVGGNVIRASDGGATITMDTSDNVTIAGDLTVSGGDINGPTDASLKINSDVSIFFKIDSDNDDSSAFYFRNSQGDILTINEAGLATFGGHLQVPGDIQHVGDTDTKIVFDDDLIKVEAGSVEFVRFNEGAHDASIFNMASADVNFTVKTPNKAAAIFVNSGQDTVRLGGNSTADIANTDVNLIFDGTAGSKDGATRGSALFMGDLVVSGTLYAEKQVMEVDMSQPGSLVLSSSTNMKNIGAGGGSTISVPANDIALFAATGSLYLKSPSGVEQAVGATYNAGNGLQKHTEGSTHDFNISINDLSGSLNGSGMASGDLIAVADVNATNNETKKVTVTNFVTNLAGDGLKNVSDKFGIEPADFAGDGLKDDGADNLAVEPADFAGNGLKDDGSDNLALDLEGLAVSLDASTLAASDVLAVGDITAGNVTKKITTTAYAGYLAGWAEGGIKAVSGQLYLDLAELGAASVNVAADSIAIIDTDATSPSIPKKESIADLMTAVAGAGLAASSGVLGVGGGTGITANTNDIEIDDSVVATLSGSQFSGHVGITGSFGVSNEVALEANKKLYFNGEGGDQFIQGTGTQLNIDGDNTVYISGDDAVNLRGGSPGTDNLVAVYPGSTEFNTYRRDIDFEVNTDDYYATLLIDGNDNTIILGHEGFDSTPSASEADGYGADVKIMLSGSKATKGTMTRGVVLMPGDVVISGSLYDGTGAQYLQTVSNGLRQNAANIEISLANISGSAAIAAADSIAFLDSDGSTKKTTMTNLAATLAGAGLSSSSGVMALDLSELSQVAISSGDFIIIEDATDNSTKKESVDDIATFFAGTGLKSASGVLSIDLQELSAATVDVGADSVAIIDASDNVTYKESIADIMTATAGNGIKATSGVLSADDSVVATLSGSTFSGVVTAAALAATSVTTDQYILHSGDVDTNINFGTDQMMFSAGGVDFVHIVEDGSQDLVNINPGNADVDFQINTNGAAYGGMMIKSAEKSVAFGKRDADGTDTSFFVSGTLAGLGTTGVAAFGGDVVVSGTLYGNDHRKIEKKSIAEAGTSFNPSATGTDAVAIGRNAVASGNYSIALGTSVTNQTDATGVHSVALGGDDATASGNYSATVGGYGNTASGDYSAVLGRASTAAGENSIAIGKSITATENNSVAIGNNTNNAKIALSGSVEIFNSLTIPEYIYHAGDSDTFFKFGTNAIQLKAGNLNYVNLESGVISLNADSGAVSTVIKTANKTAIATNNATDQVLILSGGSAHSSNEAAGLDVAFYVSGTQSSKDSAIRGTAVFGGDLHISGGLSGPSEFSFVDTSVRMYRDGNALRFDDGENDPKTLSQLAATGATTEHFTGVHGGSPATAKLKATGSIAFSGASNNFVDGLSAEGVGSDVFVFFSGSAGSRGTATRGTTLFGGDMVVSGNAAYLAAVEFNSVSATGDISAGGSLKTNSFVQQGSNKNMKLDSSTPNVLFAAGTQVDAIAAQTFVHIEKDDNIQSAAANEMSQFNLLLRNHSTQTNAFAGIAFDVAETMNVDAIGAAIRAERDTQASTNADDHEANLTFSTNDGADDGLTERMRITHDGKVGIGIATPAYALDVNGDIMIRGNDIRDSGGNVVLSFDGSGNVDVLGTVTYGSTAFNNIDIGGGYGSTGVTIEADGDIFTSGKIGIGTNTPTSELTITGSVDVSGDLRFDGSMTSANAILDEDNMASNSATALATQQSIKAYVDASTPNSLNDIGNVNTTDVTKAAGHVLIWDQSNTRWENAAITGTANEVDITLGDGSVQLGLPSNVTVSGDLKVAGGDIYGPTDAQLRIRSDSDVIVKLDADNDAVDKKFIIWDNGENPKFTVSETGVVNATSEVTGSKFVASHGNFYAAAGQSMGLYSPHHVIIHLDTDNNGTSEFQIDNGAGTEILVVNESGDLQIDGDLTVSGDDIKDSGGTTAISFDGSGNIDNAMSWSGTSIPSFLGSNGVAFANDIVHSGDTDTKIRFFTDEISFEAGGIAFLRLDETTQNQAVFNESGADIDFRVEGDTDTHALFVEASTNRVGIGKSTPAVKLHVKGDLQIEDGSSSDTIAKIYADSDDGKLDLYANNSATLSLHANGESSIPQGLTVGDYFTSQGAMSGKISAAYATDNYWLKVASCTFENSTSASASAIIMITACGRMGSTGLAAMGYPKTAMVHIHNDSDGNLLDDVDPGFTVDFLHYTHDNDDPFWELDSFQLTYNTGAKTAELWVKAPAKTGNNYEDKEIFANIVCGSTSEALADGNEIGYWTLEKNQSWSASVTSLGNDINPKFAQRVFGKLGCVGNTNSAAEPLVYIESQDTAMDTNQAIIEVQSADTSMLSGQKWISFTQTGIGTVGSINAEVSYATFTGQHPTKLLNNQIPAEGSIVKSTGNIIYRGGISNAWVETTATSTEKDKAAVGVYRGPWTSDGPIEGQLYVYNAVGEGQILVTDAGGNIDVGDYICSSARSGHGMKQDDDILHNYTVAKAVEPINWSDVEVDAALGFKSKLIACTYHSG